MGGGGEEFIDKINDAGLELCEGADSFLQSAMWGRFKSRFGWEARAFFVEWHEGGGRPLLALSRRIAPGLSMAYIPWGPELPAAFPSDPASRAGAAAELARLLRPRFHRAAFIRFDPPWSDPAGAFPPELPAPFRRAAADIQAADTVLVDLAPPSQDILAAMKPKWRYNIGLAEKRGVVVNSGGAEGVDDFYRLLAETASRDGISIHSAAYYRALFEECPAGAAGGGAEPSARLRLYTAVHGGDTLAAIAALFRGKQAVYLYGASSNNKRNLMAPYALQWRAMTDAKAAGCTSYDLFGIPPGEDPGHPMAGLYRFKTGFGGRIVHRSGSWDYPCKPALYALFRAAERLRKKARDSGKTRAKPAAKPAES